MHPIAQKVLHSENVTIPLIIDEDSALEIIGVFSGIHVSALEECISGNIPGVSLYEKDIEEDKKHLSVKDVRRWISDIAEIPYEKKHIYILRDFDEATHAAMNAALKILEEPPAYAIILLIVKNAESLLETVRSRTFNGFLGNTRPPISEELKLWSKDYMLGQGFDLLQYLFTEKIDRDTALGILLELTQYAKGDFLEKIEESIVSLYNVNETPRNVMDRIILTPGDKI